MPKPVSVKLIDRVLRRWRIAKASRYIRKGARVLDVGCADGALFPSSAIVSRAASATLSRESDYGRVRLVRGAFPDDLSADGRFGAIEHLDDAAQRRAAAACAARLRPGRRVVLTVPEPAVDRIVHFLARLGIVAGMAMHKHRGSTHGCGWSASRRATSSSGGACAFSWG